MNESSEITMKERPIRVLQVLNQYMEIGGEEIWVDKMSFLGQGVVEFHDLRFHSRAWRGRGSPGFFRQALWIGNNPNSRQRLREEIASINPDVIVFHNLIPVASFGLYTEAAQHGIPIIQYIHNFRPFSPSGTLWFRNKVDTRPLHGNMLSEIFAGSWERSRLKTALLSLHLLLLQKSGKLDKVSRWIAVSEFMRTKFVDAGIPAHKVITLRHCWSVESPTQDYQEGDHYLFLGRLVPEKGIFTLLDAWEILETQLGEACPKLILAGTGPEEAQIRDRTSQLGRVEYVGFVSGERKHHLIHTSRGLIVPSIWWEPLGLIVYEAYEASRPVIASQSGGLTETVIPHSTGYVHKAGDPHSLAECVIKMESAGQAKRAHMGQNGRDWLLSNATSDQWIQDFMAILKSITT
jgi:glycosyltransferase involved in cell wall biosynthesis